jgi:hypothetical protein
MKKAFILVITLAIFAVGCKKKDAEPSVESSWTLGTTSYKAVMSHRITPSGGTPEVIISFLDAIPVGSSPTANSLNLTFKSAPTSSGSYELVGLATALNDNNFRVAAGGPGGVYAYIGTGVKVQVTVTGGKVKVIVPEIMLKSTSSLPDIKLVASVQEIN